MADDTRPPPNRSFYTELPEEVRRTILCSFDDRKNGLEGSGENLANAFWGGGSYVSVWDCLDAILDVDLNMIVIIYERIVNLSPFFWNCIKWIRGMFFTSSAGFDCLFDQRETMPHILGTMPHTCKDLPIGERDHPGFDCWREISTDDWALHFLLGHASTDQIHIDWIGPAEGYIPLSFSCSYFTTNTFSHMYQVVCFKAG